MGIGEHESVSRDKLDPHLYLMWEVLSSHENNIYTVPRLTNPRLPQGLHWALMSPAHDNLHLPTPVVPTHVVAIFFLAKHLVLSSSSFSSSFPVSSSPLLSRIVMQSEMSVTHSVAEND